MHRWRHWRVKGLKSIWNKIVNKCINLFSQISYQRSQYRRSEVFAMKAGFLCQTGHFGIWTRKSGTPSILIFPVVHYFTSTLHTYVATCLYNCAFKMGPRFTKRVNNNTGSVPITWYWGAFVQPLLQWKRNMCYILWVCVCSLQYFSKLSDESHDFRKKIEKCVFWFSLQLLSEIFLILGRTDMLYLLTAIGLSPAGSTHLHTNNT